MKEESTYIKRNTQDKDNFDSLKKKGIELLQELSGKNWTDYNLHDPGVTILEQLCYVLSELDYLVDFDVKDFLTSEDEEIHFEDLALYKPFEIYPSEVLTHRDYCKAIFNEVSGLRNIWIEKDPDSQKLGLYRFILDTSLKYKNKEGQIRGDVKQFYLENRNLCEDIESIVFYKREPVEVAAIVEINGERTPNEILAHIFFECFKIISPRIVLHSYREMLESGISLDEILCGPELSKGYIKDEDLVAPNTCLSVSRLMKEVFKIRGVEGIIDFYLEVDNVKITMEYHFADSTSGAYLKIPHDISELKVRLMRNNRAASINMQEVLQIFYQLHNQYQVSYNTSKEIANLCELPQGNYTKFDEYFSIQNHFPDVYGINQYGIPHSATPERKAKAKQLKAYLLLFEQVVMNFLSQMENVSDLFTIKDIADPTYYTQRLKNVPHAKELFEDDLQVDEELQNEKLKEIVSKYDDAIDRRSRLIDFVLSMYGETFHQKSFQQFNYYHSKEELKQVLYQNKVYWLKNIVELNRYKSRSINYQRSYKDSDNIAMIKLKTSFLLGIENVRETNLSSVFENTSFTISNRSLESELLLFKSNYPDINMDTEYLDKHFSRIKSASEPFNSLELNEVLDQVLFARDKEICEELFRYGINLSQYRIGKLEGHKYYTLAFRSEKSGRYLYLRKSKKKETGIHLAISLQQHLIKLNQQCEGMHIVEHILLRPEIKEKKHHGVPDDFYPFKISVILPNWSARFNNFRFRAYLEETLYLNLPAHVYPEFYWLNSSKLREFEQVYHHWLDSKKENDRENSDYYSREVIQFLIENSQTQKKDHV